MITDYFKPAPRPSVAPATSSAIMQPMQKRPVGKALLDVYIIYTKSDIRDRNNYY